MTDPSAIANQPLAAVYEGRVRLRDGCPNCGAEYTFASWRTSPPRIDYECGARIVCLDGVWQSDRVHHCRLIDASAIAQQYARRMDQRTSHDAAHAVVESGKVASQSQRILDDLALHDGATAGEIEQRLGFRSHKRMAPLERDGLVRRGLSRTCAATGMKAITWWLT